jgi:hypothetical protein
MGWGGWQRTSPLPKAGGRVEESGGSRQRALLRPQERGGVRSCAEGQHQQGVPDHPGEGLAL